MIFVQCTRNLIHSYYTCFQNVILSHAECANSNMYCKDELLKRRHHFCNLNNLGQCSLLVAELYRILAVNDVTSMICQNPNGWRKCTFKEKVPMPVVCESNAISG